STEADDSGGEILFVREFSGETGALLCAGAVERLAAEVAAGFVETEKRPIAIPRQKVTAPIASEILLSRFIVAKIVDLLSATLKEKARRRISCGGALNYGSSQIGRGLGFEALIEDDLTAL